jgi:hypothetical protein
LALVTGAYLSFSLAGVLRGQSLYQEKPVNPFKKKYTQMWNIQGDVQNKLQSPNNSKTKRVTAKLIFELFCMPTLSSKKIKFQIHLHPASVGNNFFPFYAEDTLPFTLESSWVIGMNASSIFLSKET